MRQTKKSNPPKTFPLWQGISLFSFIIYMVFSIIFIVYGQINADEGWYLYSSKLVYQGQVPYQDFAYTQTPLLPYVYGLFQNIGVPSLYLGRITSVFFSTIGLILSVKTANKVSGKMAGAFTALFWGTFVYGIYFQSITKTYSLLLVLFALTFYILVADPNKERSLILASLFVVLASLTRLSALFFAFPIICYALFVGSRKTRLIVLSVCLTAVLLLGFLSQPNVASMNWNLLLHHTTQWGDISIAEKVRKILLHRLPVLFLAYPTYLILMLVIFIFNTRQIYQFFIKNRIVLLIFLSLSLFVIPHLVTGGFYTEYFVPWLFMMFSILGILFVKTFPKQKMLSRILIQTLILSTFLLGLLRGGWLYIDTSGGILPIEEVKELARVVNENSGEDDQILALEGLWIALEADRETLPGMSMAQFSFYEGDKADAVQYNLINDEIIATSIREKTPHTIILTDSDWILLKNSVRFEEINHLLLKNYSLLTERDNFGQNQNMVEIYIQKTE